MLSTLVARAGELLVAVVIAGMVAAAAAATGVWWLRRQLRRRVKPASLAAAGRARQAAAGAGRAGVWWLSSRPLPDRHWLAAARDRRKLRRAVAAAEYAVGQARRAGAPTGDLSGMCRRLRAAATAADRSLAMAGRAATPGESPDHVRTQVADLVRAAGLIQDAAASAAAAMSAPTVARLAEDVHQEVTALHAGLARATGATRTHGLPGQVT